jgi:hypothetical protein
VVLPLIVPVVLVPVVPVDGPGVIVGLIAPVVLPVPPAVVPSVEPDPALIPVEDVVHGLIVWAAADPIESVRIANVNDFARIFELLNFCDFANFRCLPKCDDALLTSVSFMANQSVVGSAVCPKLIA